MAGMDKYLKLAAAAAIAIVGVSAAPAQQAKRTAASAVKQPARIDGKPNLNGIWQVMNSANWNLEPHSAAASPTAARLVGAIGAIPAGLGVVEGGQIPYKPEAIAKRDENRKNAPAWDPEAACYLPGLPRATYMDHPFQIIQGDNKELLFAYEYHGANRAVPIKAVEVPPIDTWMGTSYGSWEGDTLKVVTLAQAPGDVKLPGGQMQENGVTWLDRSGNYLTSHATVTERFKPEGPDRMTYEVTIDDPSIYTRPWKITMPLYRHVEPNAQLMEFNCVPFSEELLYGDLLADKDKYPKK
jgi:hypothetical protein